MKEKPINTGKCRNNTDTNRSRMNWQTVTAETLMMVHKTSRQKNACFDFLLELIKQETRGIGAENFAVRPDTFRTKVNRLNDAMRLAFNIDSDPILNTQTIARIYKKKFPGDSIDENLRDGQYFITFQIADHF